MEIVGLGSAAVMVVAGLDLNGVVSGGGLGELSC